MHQLRIAVAVNFLPHYRAGMYRRLIAREDLKLTVFCQIEEGGTPVKTCHDLFPDNVELVSFWRLGSILTWQTLPWRRLLNEFDVVVLDGNPRVISHVILGFLLFLARRPTVLWIMARSYRNKPLSQWIRLLWNRQFSNILTYTDGDIPWLRDQGFKRNTITGINNGIDQDENEKALANWNPDRLMSWRQTNPLPASQVFVTCARLIDKNRFDLALESLALARSRGLDAGICLIGDGPELERLRTLAGKLGIVDKVKFVGALYRPDELAPWFLTSVALLQPAAIGLTIFTAFGFGLPVITHSKASEHGPEYCALKPRETGFNFEQGNAQSLADEMVRVVNLSVPDRVRMRERCLETVRNEFNSEVMSNRFLAAVRKAYFESLSSASR